MLFANKTFCQSAGTKKLFLVTHMTMMICASLQSVHTCVTYKFDYIDL